MFFISTIFKLSLKDIYLPNSKDSKQEKIQTLKQCRHDLWKIWGQVKELVIVDFPNDDRMVFEAVEGYILQFADEDSHSFSFRYPINMDLIQVNTQEKFINLKNLAERMEELESFLSSVSVGMSCHRDFENETLSYYKVDKASYC